MQLLLATAPELDGVVCTSDLVAAGALDALHPDRHAAAQLRRGSPLHRPRPPAFATKLPATGTAHGRVEAYSTTAASNPSARAKT